ncbi:aminoacetone oxidase family FAD-binding enzyme [Luteolibacter yonseiensis]|uniref:Aminoacetone oxidase family FAD-binding enzyme n=1 Tax=Luteolibacter yonseiensis TaxID=1144680 RepID=A0A934R712_9BACT|nr:aminoacetone oxidase family FAD-binding enzyme [Luteolibacter yonseiensis]MBK1816400.1 aminoacetone oxidase family FAD-binding enzyme [Luteolibacter yonseiensis]
MLDLAIIGGGASGFFTALQYAEMTRGKRVALFEKGSHFLQKVRISGGGRCNVTHACFDPAEMSKNYPRGAQELRAAFHRWQPADTIGWFRSCGVELKTEADGRMFPVTDSSETIIGCFLEKARQAGIPLHQNHALTAITREDDGGFTLGFENTAGPVRARAVCIATGSLKGSSLLQHLLKLEQTLQPLVPSLFAFNVSDRRISGLAGVSHPNVSVRCETGGKPRSGPILITHRGFSGPAILRLSAWEARDLAAVNHHFPFLIDWLPEMGSSTVLEKFEESRRTHGAKLVRNSPIPPISRRLWERIVSCCGITDETTWGQLPKASVRNLLDALKAARFEAQGKTTNKDEFVTCGGIDRKTIDFRTMQSRNVPGLFFVGECVDIDGITGGFNFQAAWTTAHIAATELSKL